MTDEVTANVFANLKNAAIRNQSGISAALDRLNVLAGSLESSTKALPQNVSNAVNRQLADAISKAVETAAERIIEKQTAANLQAEKAQQAYANAVEWSFARILVGGLFFFLVGIGGMVATAWHILPNSETITSLRKEKAQLEQAVTDLKNRGGKAVLTECDENGRKRLCIRTDESGDAKLWGKGNETYRVIYGY